MKQLTPRTTQLLAILLAATGCASTEVAAPGRSAGPAEARPADPALIALAAELAGTHPDDALDRKLHFLPLCDRNGRPRIGDVEPGKVRLPEQPFDPPGFCSSVRYELTH